MNGVIELLDLKNDRVRIFIVFSIFLLIIVSWLGIIDRRSTYYVDSAIIQATVAFGTARMLNALISVMQSTSIEFNLFLTGGSITVGEMLDPINDLIEQYSSLMKLSIGSLIIQKALLHIVSDVFFKVLITISGLLLVVSVYCRSMPSINLLMKTFVFLVFLRFSLVLVVAMNGLVDHYFLVDQARKDIAALDALPKQVERLQVEGVDDEDLSAAAMDSRKFLLEQKALARDKLAEMKNRRKELLQTLESSQKNLDKIEVEMSRMERMNVFSRTQEHADAIASVDAIRAEIRVTDRGIRDRERQVDAIAKEMLAAEKAEDSGPGFFGSMGQSIAGVGRSVARYARPETYAGVRDSLESAVDTILRVMTMFVLRTLILPLLFLFVLTKGFKIIWGVDVRDLVSKRRGALRNDGGSGVVHAG